MASQDVRRVIDEIPEGSRVQITLSDGEELSGTLTARDEGSLTIQPDDERSDESADYTGIALEQVEDCVMVSSTEGPE